MNIDRAPDEPQEKLASQLEIDECRTEFAGILIGYWDVCNDIAKKKLGEETTVKARSILDIKNQLLESPDLDPKETERLRRLDAAEAIRTAVNYLKTIDDLEASGLKHMILHLIARDYPGETPSSLLDGDKHKELKGLGTKILKAMQPDLSESEPEVAKLVDVHMQLSHRTDEFYRIATGKEKFSLRVYDNSVSNARRDVDDLRIDAIFMDNNLTVEEKRSRLAELTEAITVKVEPDKILINDKPIKTAEELSKVAQLFDELEQVTDRLQQATLARLF